MCFGRYPRDRRCAVQEDRAEEFAVLLAHEADSAASRAVTAFSALISGRLQVGVGDAVDDDRRAACPARASRTWCGTARAVVDVDHVAGASESHGTSVSSVSAWPGPTSIVRPLPVTRVEQPSREAGSAAAGGQTAWSAAQAGIACIAAQANVATSAARAAIRRVCMCSLKQGHATREGRSGEYAAHTASSDAFARTSRADSARRRRSGSSHSKSSSAACSACASPAAINRPLCPSRMISPDCRRPLSPRSPAPSRTPPAAR